MKGTQVAASLFAAIVLVVSGVGCGEDQAKPETLLLSVTSEALAGDARIDRLRILFVRGEQRYPSDPATPAFNPTMDAAMNPVDRAVVIGVEFGAQTFAGSDVVVELLGFSAAGVPLARFEGPIDLAAREVVAVRLRALPQGCDEDGDGFLDCTIAGCCEPGSPFADCEPTAATANPWGVELACDGLDNNCNGVTDEGFEFDGIAVGEVCPGIGACGAGVVECDDSGQAARCSTHPGGSASEATPEVCDGLDNDCDGLTDAEDPDLAPILCDKQDGVCAGAMRPVALCQGGAWQPCTDAHYEAHSPDYATVDLCDGIDNNCSGLTDEDHVDDATTCGVGECARTGVITCFEGAPLDTCAPGEPSAEICDGLDNNCSGLTDGEDPELVLVDCELQEGVCVGSQKPASLCVGGGWQACTDAHYEAHSPDYATVDLCDGIDNNCSGLTDEDHVDDATTCGVGECASEGVLSCVEGAPFDTCVEGEPSAEVCDGLDNNCSGLTDGEDPELVLVDCELQEGVCAGSQKPASLCVGGGWQACADAHYEAHSPDYATVDLCDGLDNDCDGDTDEDHVDDATTCGVGECAREGVLSCVEGAPFDTCVEGEPSAEVCDGLDNNCSGLTDGDDPNLVLVDCELQDGICAGSQKPASLCVDGGWQACVEAHYVNHDARYATVEVCNDVDNNCNGFTDADDEGLQLIACELQLGVCAGAMRPPSLCQGGVWQACTNAVYEAHDPAYGQEICDGLDNDCDGDTDEGFEYQGAAIGQPCVGVGVCGPGLVECASTEVATCSSNADGSASEATTELCDGLDNDCNGIIDDPFIAEDDGGTGTQPLSGALFSGDDGAFKDDTCGVGICEIDGGGAVVCHAEGLALICDSDPLADPWEVCEDCLDNSCTGSQDGEGCVERRVIGIFGYEEGVPAGFSISLTFDHAAMVSRGVSTESGDDVRVMWQNPATGFYQEIDLVLEPTSSWDAPDTTIWFALQAPLDAMAESLDYTLWLGVLESPTHRSPSNVFFYADLFDRAGDTLGEGWVEVEQEPEDLQLGATGGLYFQNPRDTLYHPYAYVDLPQALLAGTWRWRLGFDWTRETENTYRLMMQLGNSVAMGSALPVDVDTFPNAGVGPSLVWGHDTDRDMTTHQQLGVEQGGAFTGLGVVSGFQDIDVRIDLTSGTPNYSVNYGQTASSEETPYPFSTSQTALNRVRLISDRISAGGTSGRLFHYVIVHQGVSQGSPPRALLGMREPTACQLTDTGLAARYHLDDPRDTENSTVVKDSGPGDPEDMAFIADSNDGLVWRNSGGNWSLYWLANASTGRAAVIYSGDSKLRAGIHATPTATLELVLHSFGHNAGAMIFGYETIAGSRRFALVGTLTGVELIYNGGLSGGHWDVDLTRERTVLHLVYSAGPGTSNRTRLYVNGEEATRQGSQPDNNTNLSLDSSGLLLIGNRATVAAPFHGLIHYAAVYNTALSQGQIDENVRVLRRDTDRQLND